MKLMTQLKFASLRSTDLSVLRMAAWRHQGTLIKTRHRSGWGKESS